MATTRKYPSDRKLQLDSKRKQDERFTYRILITFAITAALFFYSLNLSRYADTLSLGKRFDLLDTMSLWTLVGVGVLAVVTLVSHLALKRRLPTLCFGYATVIAGIALVSTQFIRRFSDHQLPLAIILAGLALLYLLYFIYPRAFTLLALIDCGGAVGFWMMRRVLNSGSYGWITDTRTWPSRATLPAIAFGLAILLAAAVVLYLRAKKGRVGKFNILQSDTRYGGLLATCALLALGLLATVIFGWMLAWVSMIVSLVYLFIAAIYYTSKLM